MPRPKTKSELQTQSQQLYQKILDLIDTYTEEELAQEFPEDKLNKNVRDVLTHLHHWHVMMLGWYKVGMQGKKPNMPAEGYTWKTLPDLNVKIWEQYQKTTWQEGMDLFQKSHADIHALIERHSNEELFEKKYYHWTGSTSLGAYLVSCTSSHYDWALKKIRKSLPHQ